MPISDLFKRKTDKSEEPEEVVDPVIAQRRQEKFSKPMFLDEEDVQENEEVKTTTPKTTTRPAYQPKKYDTDTYQLSEMISPMYGKKDHGVESVKLKSEKISVEKPIEEQLVPVISPMFGITKSASKESKKERRSQLKSEKKADTVTENLRNIANIVNDATHDIRLIESKTGEFQLDLSNLSSETPSMIDEINENMDLNELMQLYEERFKSE